MTSKKNNQLERFVEGVKNDLTTLVEEIAAGKNINEICCDMKISREKLYYLVDELNSFGYSIYRDYDFKGNVKYNFGLREKQMKNSKMCSFKIPEHIKEFKIGQMSDIHFRTGSDMSVTTNICELFRKEGINIVFITGDLIDGSSSFRQGEYNLIEDIQNFVKAFPQFDNMIFVTVMGNHDYELYEKEKIDINQYLHITRHDFICLGFDYGFVGFNNDMILLQHPKKMMENIDNFELPDSPYLPKTILRIMGHRHCFNVSSGGSLMDVYSPAVTDIKMNGSTMPGFLILECKCPHNNIESIVVKNFIIYDGNIIYDPAGKNTYYVQNYETNVANQRKREEKKRKA